MKGYYNVLEHEAAVIQDLVLTHRYLDFCVTLLFSINM